MHAAPCSGGKDSCYNMVVCEQYGHEVGARLVEGRAALQRTLRRAGGPAWRGRAPAGGRACQRAERAAAVASHRCFSAPYQGPLLRISDTYPLRGLP